MIRQTSLLLLYDEQGRILLQDRKNISKFGELWGFFGGHIEEGESIEEALIRELREELEYDVKEYEFLGAFESHKARGRYTGALHHAFVAKAPPLETLTLHEGDGMKFFSISDAKKLQTSTTSKIIFDAFENWWNAHGKV